MNFWGGVLFLLPTFSLSITGGRSNVVRLLDSAMGLGSGATSPLVRDKWLDVSLSVGCSKKITHTSFLNIFCYYFCKTGYFFYFFYFFLFLQQICKVFLPLEVFTSVRTSIDGWIQADSLEVVMAALFVLLQRCALFVTPSAIVALVRFSH